MKTETIEKRLKNTYKMNVRVYPFGEDVIFFGTELECLRLSYNLKDKESRVEYSKNMESWFVSFPCFFSVEFAQNIK